MIGLLVLDDSSWWTLTGLLVKFVVIAVGAAVGGLVCVRSYAIYFGTGWFPVIAFPLAVLAGAESKFSLLKSQPLHERSFVYVWLFIALLELFLVWIPLASAFLRRRSKTPPSAPNAERSHSTDEGRE